VAHELGIALRLSGPKPDAEPTKTLLLLYDQI